MDIFWKGMDNNIIFNLQSRIFKIAFERTNFCVSMPAYNNELAILAQIARGDEAAFAALFDHYRDKVYSICIKLTHSPELSEEILQDVFLKVWIKRNDLPQITHFRAYLYTMVRNMVYNALKAAAQHELTLAAMPPGELTPVVPDDTLLYKENQQILAAAINRLPPQQQMVYKLIGEQGLKREEVSRAMGISPETVKTHIAQAMRSIRAYCRVRMGIGLLFLLFF
jgi:RNA polymerase sigma-70 factor, Bacteroides expansion family 1